MTTKQQTESILKYVEDARSDDKLLQVVYMQKSGMSLTDEQVKAFYAMGDLWDVRRYRQKFQEQGLYPATPQVEENRFQKYKRVRGEIAVLDNPEELLEARGYKLAEGEWPEYATSENK